jgi:uncharacterized BrkB/YihY/UPF0761 family membrane protein
VGFVFAGNPEAAERWIAEIAGIVPGLEEVIGRSLEALIAGRVQAGLIGLAALAWTGSSLASRAAHALARAFELPERVWYRKRLWSLLELAILGTASLAGIVLSTMAATGSGVVPALVALVLDLALSVLYFRVLTPPQGPSWRGHLPGAVLLTLTWTALKLLGGWYVAIVVTRASAVYGTIAAVVGLLAVFSIAANAFVYGAELSAVLEERDR